MTFSACCGTGHGLDDVPYKALFSCVDGDGEADGTKKTTTAPVGAGVSPWPGPQHTAMA